MTARVQKDFLRFSDFIFDFSDLFTDLALESMLGPLGDLSWSFRRAQSRASRYGAHKIYFAHALLDRSHRETCVESALDIRSGQVCTQGVSGIWISGSQAPLGTQGTSGISGTSGTRIRDGGIRFPP